MKGLGTIIGHSPAIQAVRSLIQAVARSGSSVLILGESGTGKELVAKALHDLSDRAGAGFVPVNCAAIPKELIESELFGHRKGSFTGALTDRTGRFELAHGGSLFLDEIGDLALDMQVKLLRVLQEKSIDPIGASKPVQIDARIIAATHRDIEGEIASGHFRQDLFYRLNVLPIEMPPLRDRLEDVPALVEAFARRHAATGKSPIALAPDLMHALQCYDWPGNVRELSNLIDRFSVLFPGRRLNLACVPPVMLPRGLRPYAEQMLRLAEPTLTAGTPRSDAQAPKFEGLPAIESAPASDEMSSPACKATAPDASAVCDTGHDDDAWSVLSATEPALSPAPMLDARLSSPEGALSGASDYTIPAGLHSVEEIVMMVEDQESLPDEGLHLKQHLADIERSLIRQALLRSDGNISQTARLLRLQRTTLIEKINKYDLRLA